MSILGSLPAGPAGSHPPSRASGQVQAATAACCEVVVPIFNERAVIGRVHAALVGFVDRHPGWRVRLVDDGSVDGTPALLGSLLVVEDADGRISLEALPRNVGKADAIARGMSRATAPHLFYMDGDLAYDPELLVELDRALATHDVAIGSRSLGEGGRTPGPLRRVLGESFNRLVRIILGLPHRDTQAGIKGFRREAAERLFARRQSRDFGFDAELLFIARRLGLSVAEIPVRVNDDHRSGGSNVRLVRDPLRMLAGLFRIRWRALRGAYRA